MKWIQDKGQKAALISTLQYNFSNFGAIAVQFWCILSCIRLLKQGKNFLGWAIGGGAAAPAAPLNKPLVKVTNHGTIRYVRYGFLLVSYSNIVRKTHHFWDIRLQKCRDLENRVKGPWRSLKMSPFDRDLMTLYWCSIVTMALSHVVSDIFNVVKILRPWNTSKQTIKVIESGTIR